MKKILILSLLISCSQFFMSCENWFDVNPKSQVKNDILFENENGYKTALFGIWVQDKASSGILYEQRLRLVRTFYDWLLLQCSNCHSKMLFYFKVCISNI